MSLNRFDDFHSAWEWLRQVRVLIVKEWRQLVLDRTLFFFLLYIFTVPILIAGGEVTSELRNALLAVRGKGHGHAAREWIDRFRQPYFVPAREAHSDREALELLDRGEVSAVLDIPPDFEEILATAREPATAQLIVDTSKSRLGYLIASYSARITAGYGQEWAEANLARLGSSADLPGVENDYRIWFNPALTAAWLSTIGDFISWMTIACVMLPATALVREKERGTIEQLLVSPLSPVQIMLAKVVSMQVVMLAGTALSLFGIMQPFFSVPVNGSLLLFFVLTGLQTYATSGIGLVVGTYARSAAQVGMLVFLLVLPMIMLSGTHSRFESMPAWLQTVMSLSPMHYYADITLGILLRGAGLNLLWRPVGSLALIGTALFAVGVWRFRRQFR
jgi:ABC-2 type transport system permease protein